MLVISGFVILFVASYTMYPIFYVFRMINNMNMELINLLILVMNNLLILEVKKMMIQVTIVSKFANCFFNTL